MNLVAELVVFGHADGESGRAFQAKQRREGFDPSIHLAKTVEQVEEILDITIRLRLPFVRIARDPQEDTSLTIEASPVWKVSSPQMNASKSAHAY